MVSDGKERWCIRYYYKDKRYFYDGLNYNICKHIDNLDKYSKEWGYIISLEYFDINNIQRSLEYSL